VHLSLASTESSSGISREASVINDERFQVETWQDGRLESRHKQIRKEEKKGYIP